MTGKEEVNLWDLTEMKIYVKLKKEIICEFFDYAISLTGSESKLASALKMKKVYNIWYYKNISRFIPLRLITKIMNILPKEKKDEFKKRIEENLEELRYGYGLAKSIRNPKLPIKFSPILARIIGHVIGDGGIRMTKGDYPVYYTNKCDTLVNQFKEDIWGVFGDVDVYDYHNKNDGTRMVRFPSTVGIILINFFGSQVSSLKHVPEIILNSDKKSKAMFLRALFDDEGCVSSDRIHFGISNRDIIKKVGELLKEFGIRTGIITERKTTEKWKASYQFGIFGRVDICIFEQEIGFNHHEKKEKLRYLVESYNNKQIQYKKGEIRNLIIEKLKNNSMSIYELSKNLSRKPSHRLREQLYKLGRDKLIKSRTEKGRLKIYYV